MAIKWVDRVPTYANRMKITPESGDPYFATVERADEPTVVGTPVNAVNLNAMQEGNGLTENKEIYVSTIGSDSTGDGSSASPYATIQKALDSITKNLNGYTAYVSIAAGTYNEMVEVVGFSNGELRFTGASGSVITIDKLTIDTTTMFSCQTIQLNIPTGSKDTVAIDVTNNSYATFGQPVTVSGTETGVVSREESRVRFTTLTANNIGGSAVYANGGRVHVQNLAGTNNGVAINANRGGVATYESMTLASTVKFFASNGGRILSGSQAQIPSY